MLYSSETLFSVGLLTHPIISRACAHTCPRALDSAHPHARAPQPLCNAPTCRETIGARQRARQRERPQCAWGCVHAPRRMKMIEGERGGRENVNACIHTHLPRACIYINSCSCGGTTTTYDCAYSECNDYRRAQWLNDEFGRACRSTCAPARAVALLPKGLRCRRAQGCARLVSIERVSGAATCATVIYLCAGMYIRQSRDRAREPLNGSFV